MGLISRVSSRTYRLTVLSFSSSKMASQNDISAAEAEFQKKYGGMGGGMKPRMGQGGGMNSVLAKRLQGGGQKWFDSGDYNMNKNKAQPNVPSPIYKPPAAA